MDEDLDKFVEEQIKQKQNLPTTTDDKSKSGAMQLVEQQEKALLNTEEVINVANRIGQERLHSDFEKEATEIEKQNVDNKQQRLANKKKKRKLEREEAEEELEHKYKMQEIKRNAEHKRMLDNRKKLVEKYNYLYDEKEITTAFDSDGNEYKVPKDFSYSNFVNRVRQFGRNMSKLDRPLLQSIKWVLILGAVAGGIFILKSLNVI